MAKNILFRVECPNCLELNLSNKIECIKCDNDFDGKLIQIWWQENSNPISFSGMSINIKPLEPNYMVCVKTSCIIRHSIDFIASNKNKGYFSFEVFLNLSNKLGIAHNIMEIGIKIQFFKNIKYFDEGKIARSIKGCTAMTKLIIFDCWSQNFNKLAYK